MPTIRVCDIGQKDKRQKSQKAEKAKGMLRVTSVVKKPKGDNK